MTTVLIPMAGQGSRFQEEGYTLSKPVLPLTERRKGKKVPMVVAATYDLLDAAVNEAQLIYIDRDFHLQAGVQEKIKKYVPGAEFITIDYCTEGQASTCLLAKDYINNDRELIIGACDNGMVIDSSAFRSAKEASDVIIFTYRNHDLVLTKPEAHGWVKVAEDGITAIDVSVKKPISSTPLNDHAIVASFWFRRGADFITAAEEMIAANDRINDEFYVDQAMKYMLKQGLRVRVFEVTKYLCWGTPKDYEEYENRIRYWREYIKNED